MENTSRPVSGIWVEILIRRPLAEVWQATQDPAYHQLWDLRFSGIEYLPRPSEAVPQRFRYSTRLGAGLRIDGEGETMGSREGALGDRSSALKFWSGDPKSLIRRGSGYWRYSPADASATRFVTWYDYDVRFGVLGRTVDRLVFRPLIAWATAWSFDRLRLWLENGLAPAVAFRLAALHALARLAIAFVWAWQGLVPKLLWPHPDEAAMIASSGLPSGLITLMGGLELVMAALAMITWRWRGYFILNLLAMLAALAAVTLSSPAFLFSAFNAVTLNWAVAALALAGYVASTDIPTSARCQWGYRSSACRRLPVPNHIAAKETTLA